MNRQTIRTMCINPKRTSGNFTVEVVVLVETSTIVVLCQIRLGLVTAWWNEVYSVGSHI